MKQKIKKKQNSMWFGEPHLFLERGSPTGLRDKVTMGDRVEYLNLTKNIR